MSSPILVVEDNEDLLLLFELVLKSAGYEVVALNNGRDVLNNLAEIQPQLVLMDIMMPRISGLQVTRNIKQQSDYKNLPILLVSAIDRLEDQQFQDSKADGIIYKPFHLDELLFKVDELVGDRQSYSVLR